MGDVFADAGDETVVGMDDDVDRTGRNDEGRHDGIPDDLGMVAIEENGKLLIGLQFPFSDDFVPELLEKIDSGNGFSDEPEIEKMLEFS